MYVISSSFEYNIFGSSTNSTFSTVSGNFIVIDGSLYKSYFAPSVINFIPEILKSADYVNAEDWNFNTIEETAKKFDILRPVHPEIDAKKFWSAVVRGGIQAAVYVSDSVK